MSKSSLKRAMRHRAYSADPPMAACACCGKTFPVMDLIAQWCPKCRETANLPNRLVASTEAKAK